MDFPSIADFAALLGRVATALQERDIAFMVIGGQAVLLHGEARLTEDIDLTLATDPVRLPYVLEACAALRLEVLPDDVEGFVRETFVLPVEDGDSGIRLDLIFSTTPYEAEAIERAVHVRVGGAEVPFAAAEDLVLHKLFAGRPRDVEDARGVVRRRAQTMDWSYLRRWAEAFSSVPGREGMPEQVEELWRHGVE